MNQKNPYKNLTVIISLCAGFIDVYNVDINVLDSNPKGQQIILENIEELALYLVF